MNQDLIAHLAISALLLSVSVLLFLFSSDPRAHDLALVIIPLVAGYWIPSPREQRQQRST